MRSIAILRAEHQAATTALDLIERTTEAIAGGTPVPAETVSGLAEFLLQYAGTAHQWKEEAAIFPRLERCCTQGASLVRRLGAEHHAERELAREFRAAVASYRPDDRASGTRLVSSVRAYAAAIRRHIDIEAAELFPAMSHALADADRDVADRLDLVAIQLWHLRRAPGLGSLPVAAGGRRSPATTRRGKGVAPVRKRRPATT